MSWRGWLCLAGAVLVLRCGAQTLHGESNDIKTTYAHLLLRHAQGARHGG